MRSRRVFASGDLVSVYEKKVPGNTGSVVRTQITALWALNGLPSCMVSPERASAVQKAYIQTIQRSRQRAPQQLRAPLSHLP